ncbi:hypothetical protein M408DRAFT_22410 [Serendipita vermifera MAFF 305830]|uniref:Uncharacterized protein n=1 Tax=Serendipita vermifera MAFF 305830 TaxID=933852 RepID=A0A0C2WUU6_SERVB|nr:hypothetical protein M408DRAFT_22410 [Serendipita vermifera MAFF 305830]
MDQTYRNLLLHLQTSTKSLHKGIPPTLAHYLSTLPLPLPTTLTASAIASPAWTSSNVSSLLLAFRHAVHQKVDSLVAPTEPGPGPSTTGSSSSSVFSLSPGPTWNLRKWAHAICSGARNGQPFVRAAALGGLLLGLEDVKDRLNAGGARWKVEDEVIVAFAEYFEGLDDGWVIPVRDAGQRSDKEEIVYIASYVLTVVSEDKFKVLNLSSIISHSIDIVDSIFQDARFLKSQSNASNDPHSETIGSRLPHIARLTSRAIEVLSDNPTGQKIEILHKRLQETTDIFDRISQNVEEIWAKRELTAASEAEREKVAWVHLKALLFTAVMNLQSVTDSVLYNALPSNPSLASHILEIFSHLSFISTKFGGVVARGEGTFREYQRAFYTALDIVAASPPHGEQLVVRLGEGLGGQMHPERPATANLGGQSEPLSQQVQSIQLAKTAYYLAVVEQLVDQLSIGVLLDSVLPICKNFLDKPQHREVFESSHSVVLALFASLGKQKAGLRKHSQREDVLRFIVPFYASSLIACSADGMLNVTQLRLAFSSLIAGAGANSNPLETESQDIERTALVWYCIECLLSEIQAKYHRERKQDGNSSEEQYERLVLTLVSLIAAIPPSPAVAPLLTRVLHEIKKIVLIEEDVKREKMIKAIYDEVLGNVGDATREVVLKWWFDTFRQDSPTLNSGVVGS